MAGRGDALAHRLGGVQGDVVLGRAPARQDRDPHGVAVGVADGVAFGSVPTAMVTVPPVERGVSAAGRLADHAADVASDRGRSVVLTL